MSWIIALLGLAAAGAGGTAIFFGWPLVPLEKGWTMVIAGAALGSGGLVCLAVAVLIGETRRTRRAIERMLAGAGTGKPAPTEVEAVSTAPASPRPDEAPTRRGEIQAKPDKAQILSAGGHTVAEPAATPRIARAMPMQGSQAAARPEASEEPPPGAELQPARSFTIGETTFVVFEDGSIEARTREGTRRFASMDEVRAYLETSAA
jgi:hypothetical protein